MVEKSLHYHCEGGYLNMYMYMYFDLPSTVTLAVMKTGISNLCAYTVWAAHMYSPENSVDLINSPRNGLEKRVFLGRSSAWGNIKILNDDFSQRNCNVTWTIHSKPSNGKHRKYFSNALQREKSPSFHYILTARWHQTKAWYNWGNWGIAAGLPTTTKMNYLLTSGASLSIWLSPCSILHTKACGINCGYGSHSIPKKNNGKAWLRCCLSWTGSCPKQWAYLTSWTVSYEKKTVMQYKILCMRTSMHWLTFYSDVSSNPSLCVWCRCQAGIHTSILNQYTWKCDVGWVDCRINHKVCKIYNIYHNINSSRWNFFLFSLVISPAQVMEVTGYTSAIHCRVNDAPSSTVYWPPGSTSRSWGTAENRLRLNLTGNTLYSQSYL